MPPVEVAVWCRSGTRTGEDKVSDIPIFDAVEALPPRIGLLWLADVEVFEDPRAGVCFRYRYPEKDSHGPADLDAIAERLGGPRPDLRLLKADVYLYNPGLPVVPADLMSDETVAILQQALAEVTFVAEQGHYQQFEIMSAGLLNVPPAAAESAWLWAAMRYRQTRGPLADDDQDRVSHLAVRTDGGYINKVRYTYTAAIPASRAYSDFLLFLFEWRHSIGRVLAGKGAVPPSGDPDDPEWLRTVTELQIASLPHPLWFFDPTAAEARQAELLMDHLQVEAGAPERPLEGHEVRDAVHHEVAHAIFSILEREMAMDIEIGGFGAVADGRNPPKT